MLAASVRQALAYRSSSRIGDSAQEAKRPRTPDGRKTSSTPATPTRPRGKAPGRPHPTRDGAIPRSRFIRRVHHHDGTTVYQWPVGSSTDEHLREIMQRQAERFRAKFGRDPRPEDPIFFDSDADKPRPHDPDTATREISEQLRHAGTEVGSTQRSSRPGVSWATWSPRTPSIYSPPARLRRGTRQSAVTRVTST
jgi:hypothetical protein